MDETIRLKSDQIAFLVADVSLRQAVEEFISSRLQGVSYQRLDLGKIGPPPRILNEVVGTDHRTFSLELLTNDSVVGTEGADPDCFFPLGDFPAALLLAISWRHGVSMWTNGGDYLNFLDRPASAKAESFFKGGVWFKMGKAPPWVGF